MQKIEMVTEQGRIRYNPVAAVASYGGKLNSKSCCAKHPWKKMVGVCSLCLQEKLLVLLAEACRSDGHDGYGYVSAIASPPPQRTTLRSLFAMADVEASAPVPPPQLQQSHDSSHKLADADKSPIYLNSGPSPASSSRRNWANWNSNSRNKHMYSELLWGSLLCRSKKKQSLSGAGDIIWSSAHARQRNRDHNSNSKSNLGANSMAEMNNPISYCNHQKTGNEMIYARSASSGNAWRATTTATKVMMQKSRTQHHGRFQSGPISAAHHHTPQPPPPPPPFLRFPPFRSPSSASRPFTLGGRPSYRHNHHNFLSALFPHKLLAFL